jgi:hypothetical protein
VCKTAHATAFAAVGHRYTRRLNSPRQPAWKTGQALGITRPFRIGAHEIGPRALSHTVLRTVTRYCYSADRTLARHHVPRLRGLDTPGDHARLADEVRFSLWVLRVPGRLHCGGSRVPFGRSTAID